MSTQRQHVVVTKDEIVIYSDHATIRLYADSVATDASIVHGYDRYQFTLNDEVVAEVTARWGSKENETLKKSIHHWTHAP